MPSLLESIKNLSAHHFLNYGTIMLISGLSIKSIYDDHGKAAKIGANIFEITGKGIVAHKYLSFLLFENPDLFDIIGGTIYSGFVMTCIDTLIGKYKL